MTAQLRLFFIVASPRSGTTLLAAMLNAHPNIAVSQETHFIPRYWQKRREHGNLQDDAVWWALVDRLMSETAFVDMRMDRETFREGARTAARSYDALFRLLLSQYAEREGVTLVGEKTPMHALAIPTLDRWFPEARYVEIVRDPRAVVASMKKVPWSHGSTTANADLWRKHVGAVRRDGRRLGKRLYRLRYADLVTDPESTLRPVCAFLGMEFSPAMLEYTTRRRWEHNFEKRPWIDGVTRAPYAEALDRWRTELDDIEIADTERVCYFEMRRLGMAPEGNHRSVLAAATRWAAARKARRLARRTVRVVLRMLGRAPAGD